MIVVFNTLAYTLTLGINVQSINVTYATVYNPLGYDRPDSLYIHDLARPSALIQEN